jgi:MFS family permease
VAAEGTVANTSDHAQRLSPAPIIRAWSARTFASLGNHNYRRFFVGQSVSLIGTWMQSVAQSWLVLQLTDSGTALGLVVAVQTLPVLLLAPYAGLIVDRANKRHVLLATQCMLASLAVVLGVLTLTHVIRLWMVIALAAGLGFANSVDNPARQAFIPEMVGADAVVNAVSLNSVMTNAARAIGPAIAGLLIVTVGIGDCFLLNAASFIAIILALVAMNPARLHPAQPAEHGPGQIMDGLRYVRHTPRLLIPLLMMALIGALSYEFQVVLPVLAQRTFRGDADAYGFLTATFGAGAVVGGLVVAGRRAPGLRAVVVAAGAFGLTLLAAAVAPSMAIELAAMSLVGAASVAFMSRGNSLLQLTAEESMRGRVMALWAVALIGTTPIGGPIIGYITEHASPRWGLATGGFAALIATSLALRARHHHAAPPSPAPPGAHDLPPGAGPS